MFAVIYQFKVKKGLSSEFIEGWNGLTKLIYQFEGSLGSRLHQEDEDMYIAYAQWPDEQAWKTSGNNLPPESEKFRTLMRISCHEINTIHKLNMVSDLLANQTYVGES